MHDIKTIRADPAAFDAAMLRRRLPDASAKLLALDAERRAAATLQQDAQSRRNTLAREIGQAKRTGADTAAQEAEATSLRGEMERLDGRSAELDAELRTALAALPNVMDAEVPDGTDETANRELKNWGTPRAFDFPARQHFELGEALGMMDFERAAKISGSRFTILLGDLARLERALGQFMLDMHTTQHGYSEVSVPALVNEAAFFGTNQLPKFAEDSFRTTDGRWLIPTAEVPITNMVAGDILPEAALADTSHGADRMFPQRSRLCRARYAWHVAPAPVPQGRAGQYRPSRPQRRRARAHDALRRGRAGSAGDTVSPYVVVRGRYRFRRGAHA